MYTPHTVTLVNVDDGIANAVILKGVFLDLSKRSNVNRSGLSDADRATLFIPFGLHSSKDYLPPKEYARQADKSGFWTLRDDGEDSGADCYFIKGAQTEDLAPFSTAVEAHDFVFRVSSVDLRDFGMTAMQHWMVGGR